MTQEAKLRFAPQRVGGRWTGSAERSSVLDKFTGEKIGEVAHSTQEDVQAAVAAARHSFEANKLEPYLRYQILIKAAGLIEKRRKELETTIIAEAGLPLVDASNEVTRSAEVFTTSAEEAKRLTGTGVPIEGAAGQAQRMAFTIRVPRGVVCGITSFNSPLNMVAHKVAPALASGNSVVIKPAEQTPLSPVILTEILLDAGLPPSHMQLLQGPGAKAGQWLIENRDIDFYSFTGSTEVGRHIRQIVGLRPNAMELGSIAATIVAEDADLERAAVRVAASGFRRAGQSCNSTQRLYVHEPVLEDFTALLLRETGMLPVGDPHDPRTIVGPMISEADAMRAERWVTEAVAQGARLLCGGRRERSLFYPTILTDVDSEMRVMSEEIFAPVLSIVPFGSFEDAIAQANATPFGLGVGVFTQDLTRALSAARQLHFGIVHINETSSSRVDMMPFSGVKESGIGGEGPRYAMEAMTEERLITISLA